ncbi:hypothetical protein NQ318_013749 [Aromia moschata]|uniref:Uncharacterized protein n=1 Tax=Aromia moschata TaxID=1265417 RepID=A0AAV8Z989_9CUCU|nr:hypothetical protein NQ318_013749 [Aromia moschata]
MANPPHQIAHRKSWNSWNTSNLQGGLRPSETAVEDQFIRKFMVGTWHRLFAKRDHNKTATQHHQDSGNHRQKH